MTTAGWTVAIWGVFNLILASLLFIFPEANGFSFAQAYGMAGTCIVVGLVLVAVGRRRRRRAGPQSDYDTGTRLLPDLSYSTTLLGLALFGLVLSAAFGKWLTLISAGLALVAAAGLIREGRAMAAERRGRREARGGSGRMEARP
jgi:protein-S-isoprenylcysteine O-methyltransferase Ste14